MNINYLNLWSFKILDKNVSLIIILTFITIISIIIVYYKPPMILNLFLGIVILFLIDNVLEN